MFHHFRNICLGALAIGLLAAPLGAPAGADPVTDKRAEAAALQAQITETNQKLSAMGEQFNAAQLRLDEAEANLAAVQAQIDATKAEVARMQGVLEERAAGVYRRAASGHSIDEFDLRNAQQLASRERYAAAQSADDNRLLDQLSIAKEQLRDQRTAAESARDAAAVERQRLADTKASLEVASAEQEALLGQVQGDIARLIEEEMERLEAEALARARASYGKNPESYPDLAPPGPSTAKAIDFAYEQIGKTYVYAASGPDHYDCSGLVMAAFKTAGVSLPHYSGAQYEMLPHVPLDGMQRGDLVFWGGGGSSHVAIYLGEGQIIESGGTGHNTHVGPIWGHPSGAARILK